MAIRTSIKVARLTFNMPIDLWRTFSRMAEARSISKTEALRRAISLELFRYESELRGFRFALLGPNGEVEKVNFPY